MWLTMETETGKYLGTFYIVDKDFVEYIKTHKIKAIKFTLDYLK